MGRRLQFDTKGNEKQKEVARLWLDDSVTDILYAGTKGAGKSYLGCSLIGGDALTYPETFYFIARKTAADLVRYTIPSIYEVFTHWGITKNYYHFNGQYNFFELYNKSRIYLIDAKYNPSDPMYERFGSMQITSRLLSVDGRMTSTSWLPNSSPPATRPTISSTRTTTSYGRRTSCLLGVGSSKLCPRTTRLSQTRTLRGFSGT